MSGRELALSQYQLLSLCAGLVSARDAIADCADEALIAEVAAMFSVGDPIYWMSDEV